VVLFLECVDEEGGELTVLDALDLAALSAECKSRLHRLHFFRCEADVGRSALLPFEADRAEAFDDVKPTVVGLGVRLSASSTRRRSPVSNGRSRRNSGSSKN